MTTTNYVLNVMAQVKHLTPPMAERDLVYKLARHFSERTRVATTTRGVDTLGKFIMVVDECQDLETVSYTHLDVYKRQVSYCAIT